MITLPLCFDPPSQVDTWPLLFSSACEYSREGVTCAVCSLNTLRRSVTQQHVARASSPDIACMEARSLSTPAICDSQFSTAPDSPGEPPSDAQPAAASQGSHDVPSYQRGTYRAASLPDLTASSSAPEDEEAAGAPAATGAIRGRGVLRRRSSAPEDLVVSTLGSSSLPASPVRRRAKLESLDKLIGQPPDIMHHVRLHAPPSQVRPAPPSHMPTLLCSHPHTRHIRIPRAQAHNVRLLCTFSHT